MISLKQLMGVVEKIMGEPFQRKPRFYRWTPHNVYKMIHSRARIEGQSKEAELADVHYFLESKMPFTYKGTDAVLLCPDDLHPYVQTHINLHELTHAFTDQHWPRGFKATEVLIQNWTEEVVERVMREKILHEGLAEYVSIRVRNPVARVREKELINYLEEKGGCPFALAEAVEAAAWENPQALVDNEFSYYVLGWGLLETAMRDSENSPWETYDELVREKPSVCAIGELIDPSVYEVKEST